MGITVCPAAVVAAPVEIVWELLCDPKLRDEWWDTHTERVVPEGKASPSQVIYLVSSAWGRQVHGTLTIEAVDPVKHQIHWRLSAMGVINDQTTTCTALDAASCRIQYG